MNQPLTQRQKLKRMSCVPVRSRMTCLKTRLVSRDYNFCQLNFQQMYDSLGKNVVEYVQSQRVKLKSMDWNRSSKLVNKVQNNLLNFLKNKANIKLVSKSNKVKSPKVNLRMSQSSSHKQYKIFDENKLMEELQQIQKMKQKQNKQQGYLIQKTQKQVEEQMRDNIRKIPLKKQHQIFSQTSKSYMGFGTYKQQRKEKFILF